MQKRLNQYRYEVVKLLRMHQTFVVLTLMLLILVIAMLRINSMGRLPLDQTYIDKKSSEIKAVKFNAEAINQIEALRDSNVLKPGTELPSSRQNPFNE